MVYAEALLFFETRLRTAEAIDRLPS